MRESGKLAEIYARALAETAMESAGTDSDQSEKEGPQAMEDISLELEGAFAAFSHEPQVWKFFESPLPDSQQKLMVLSLHCKSILSATVYSFLCVLARRKRMDILPDVVQAMKDATDRAFNRKRVELRSAEQLSDDQKSTIREQMKRYLNAEVELEESIDSKLISGFVLRSGDLLIDMSLQKTLKGIGDVLHESKTIGRDFYYEL